MKKEHLAAMIRQSAEVYSSQVALRIKESGVWKETTYKEMVEIINALSLALIDMGVKEGQTVGIFSQNKPQWTLADFAILSIGAIAVPIYATNTLKQTEYIVNDAEIEILFLDSTEQYSKVQEFNKKSKKLKKIIVIDKAVKLEGDESIYFDDVVALGKKSKSQNELAKRLEKGKSSDLATLIYTSGTTGDPKGVMLTHSNFYHQIKGIAEHFNITKADKSLCFLPLSHAYERAWCYIVFNFGAQVNYLADTKAIVETMPEVQPTAMVSVPRLYEKIYATAFNQIEKASPVKKKLFMWAVEKGKKYQYSKKDKKFIGPWLAFTHGIANKLVLSKIRGIVGGPKNFFSAGGAALSKEIEEFFFAAGLLVCQGYGLTETSPVISCNRPAEFKFGTVGKLIADTEIKISEQGEILIKGGNLMQGYYKKPAETASAIVDGWFHTGDIGELDSEGYLRITDRIKDIMITAQGKNLSPLRIESIVGMDYYIEQVMVIGEKRPYITGLIVPNFIGLEEYAKDQGISWTSREDLVAKPEIIEFYKSRIETASVELAGYEQIKRFKIMPNEFTQEGGELTPTLKMKRRLILEKYKAVIDELYA